MPPLHLPEGGRDPLSPVRETGGHTLTGAGAQRAAKAQQRVTFAFADDNAAEEDHATGADLTQRTACRRLQILPTTAMPV